MTYTYTDRSWLSTITSAQFWEHLGYNNIAEIGSALSSPAQYNGNISWMSYSEAGNIFQWGPPQTTTTIGYAFGYDKANRLTAGNFGYYFNGWSGYNSYKMPKIGYDKNGNIDTLARYGTNATLMDNLKYHYLANSNRLDYITDGVTAGTFSTDIDNQLTGNYKYDENGNVQADSGSGMGFIIYDVNNLPVTEFKRDGTVIQYTYDNMGQRAIKLVGSSYTWYIPGADGKSEALYANATTNPTYNVWGGDNVGQVRRNGSSLTRYYYLKDHLGDIRMTVTASGTVDSYYDYYPFGQQLDGRNLVGSADGRYKYTGKERDAEIGWDYFGARYYDSRIGRWLGVDPQAHKTMPWTPYAYAKDSPIRYYDPNGLTAEERAQAVEAAKSALKDKIPYGTMDCAALVAKGIMAAGFKDPRNYGEAGNGVAKIANKSRGIDRKDLRVGDIVTFRTTREVHQGPDGMYDHIGIVSDDPPPVVVPMSELYFSLQALAS